MIDLDSFVLHVVQCLELFTLQGLMSLSPKCPEKKSLLLAQQRRDQQDAFIPVDSNQLSAAFIRQRSNYTTPCFIEFPRLQSIVSTTMNVSFSPNIWGWIGHMI